MHSISKYKQELDQFVIECERIRGSSNSWEITSKNIATMKIYYTPTLKLSLAARFDYVAGVRIKALQSTRSLFSPEELSNRVPAQLIVGYAKELIRSAKDEFIEEVKKGYLEEKHKDTEWRQYGLEKWLDGKIKSVTMQNSMGSIDDVQTIMINFWQSCSEEWTNKNNLERYFPDKALSQRMKIVSDRLNLATSDCAIFTACYLKIEDLMKDRGSVNLLNILSVEGYRLVYEPLANDVILYFDSDSNDEPSHFAVLADSEWAISKLGCLLNTFKHKIKDENATSYVLVRQFKPEAGIALFSTNEIELRSQSQG